MLLLYSPELDVGAVEVVQQADHSKALVELEMVIVVELRGEEERQVVAGVAVDGGDEAEAVPGPGGDQVAPHQQGAKRHREQVREGVLQGVRVECSEAEGRAPLVVDLVHARVKGGAVQGDVRVEEADLLDEHEHSDLSNDLKRWGKLPGNQYFSFLHFPDKLLTWDPVPSETVAR